MKLKAFILAAALVCSTTQSAHAGTEKDYDFSRSDHKLHTTLGYGLTLTGAGAFKKLGVPHPTLMASLMVFAAGYIKEFTDPHYELGDLKANTVGIAAGALVGTLVFTF
jgi:hypothetical protein